MGLQIRSKEVLEVINTNPTSSADVYKLFYIGSKVRLSLDPNSSTLKGCYTSYFDLVCTIVHLGISSLHVTDSDNKTRIISYNDILNIREEY